MTWVIGPLCIDKMDTACVEVCPVDCIHLYTGDDPTIPTINAFCRIDQQLIVPPVNPPVRGKRFIKMLRSLRSLRSSLR
jgi:hypothetical protein